MISKKMQAAINEQINKEFFSAYLYLAMAAQSDDMGLTGFGAWFSVQAQEEVQHAMKFYAYVNEQGGRVILDAIAKPQTEFSTPLELFEQTLEHERFITKSIYSLVDLAIEEKDHATNSFLKWYVDEQVEEEATAQDAVSKLKMIGPDSSGALLMMDREFGGRSAGTGAEEGE